MLTERRHAILIVDEVEINQDKYRSYLNVYSDIDYTIITAKSAKDVLNLCCDQTPWNEAGIIDAIILKYHLSDQDGLAVLKTLKSQWGKSCPPVVMIAEDNTALAVQAMKAGAEDYLVEDQFTPEQLRFTIKTAIQNAELRQAEQSREEQFRAIFNHTFQFIGLLTVEGILIEANQTALDFAGLIRADVINRPFWEVRWWTISTATQDKLKAAITQAAKGEFVRYEVEVLGVGDRIVTIDFSLKPLLDQSGTVILLLPEGRDISDRVRAETERQHLEAQLRESEERWQLTLRGSNDGVWDWNIITNEVFFSARWKEMLGYPDHEINNHLDEWAKRVHPDDINWVMQAIQDHFERKTPFYSTEHRVQCKDGTYKWILDRGQALWDEAGNVVRMAGTHTDMTKRKQLEARLQQANQELEQRVAARTAELQQVNATLAEREATLRSYYDNAPMLMGVVEITENDILHIYDNSTTCRFFGHEPGSTTGKLASELGVTPTIIQVWLTQYRESELRGEPVKFEYVHEDNQKHLIYLSVTVAPINSSVFRHPRFCYVAEEITTRKQIEETLLQNDLKIRRQLNEIESIYQTAPIGLGALDTELRFVRINQRLAEINGIPVEAHLGRSVRETVPNLASEVEPILRNIIQTGEPVLNIEINGETAAQPGVSRTWLESWHPLKDDNGQVIGINIVCEEISDVYNELRLRKQLEIEREQLLQREQAARKQAEASNRIKDEFLAVLSHELRTPLNPILGWIKLIRSGRLEANKTAEALEAIERNADLQLRLIEDLLNISRIMQGKITLNVSTVNLVSITRAAIETVHLALENKNIQIQTIIEPNLGKVAGDAARLQQILWNLLSNAVKFTPPGGKIEIRLEQIRSYAQITISDTGKGISAEFLPYIFNYFWQEDSSITRNFGGLGLGLAIVRNLVELHGGTITAHSPGIGQGATFTVKLPITFNSETPKHNQQQDISFDFSGIKVLVVDDDADSLEFVTFVLRMYQAEVITASSGLEALQILARLKPDVLVSDIGMPQMNGYELLQQIRTRTSANNGQIPAIALTAYAGELYQKQAQAVGFQMHIPKPIEPDTLASAVARLVGMV
ncbi:PAS domain S-box protein [Nostoc sp. UHCC 0870]|uniref:PAS domain S-box protein n=1 Tax=Nostoc sp. UHCC 0870 TaxID=2914041 RepID=UPI001EDEF59C|nr:PAS domain S-box protein [Nostoc sp. UHCC 0870]UKO96778.1 PAS domain S-box protein [Nostoc sp. UHCC 0870]